MPFPMAPIIAAAAAMVIGVVFALPAVRIRGLPVAVVTLALAVALEAVWFRNVDLVSIDGKDITGPSLFGARPVGRLRSRLPAARLLPSSSSWSSSAIAVGVSKLRTSRLGAAMLAVRANERAAAAAGINVVRTKIARVRHRRVHRRPGGLDARVQAGQRHRRVVQRYLGLSLFATATSPGITSVSGAMVAGVLAIDGVLVTFLRTMSTSGRGTR